MKQGGLVPLLLPPCPQQAPVCALESQNSSGLRMALFQLPPTLKVRLNPTKAVSPLERMATALVKPQGSSETCTTAACSPVRGGLGRAAGRRSCGPEPGGHRQSWFQQGGAWRNAHSLHPLQCNGFCRGPGRGWCRETALLLTQILQTSTASRVLKV